MFDQIWYFGLIRKYTAYFGALFDDLVIYREAEDDATNHQVIKVPLSYGPKEKMLVRVDSDPDINRPFAALLPRMSFEITGFNYDGERKLGSINKFAVKAEDSNKVKYQFVQVPYNINFRLSIWVKNAYDGQKIVEQILPFFTPSFTASLELIPEMNIVLDTPITLLNVTQEDHYDGSFKERRVLVWYLDFVLKGSLFGPVKETGIIKVANTSFYIANTADGEIRNVVGLLPISERVILTPGLDANGDPVHYTGTRPANTTSVPFTEIEEDDDWGVITTIESVNKIVGQDIDE